MNKVPLISIIITTFNDLENLVNNISLIKNQTFKNFELIIINDCSSDNTKNYLDSLKDKNIIKFNLKKNYGPGYARNIGIKNSNGIWLSFLDSDDFWTTERLNIVEKYLDKNYDLDLICHNEYKLEKLKKIKKKLHYGPLNSFDPYKDLLLNGNRFSTSATIIKKNFLEKNEILFDESKKFFSVEDYDFWLKCAKHGMKFKFLNLFLGYYNVHENNITKNIFNHKKNYLRVLYNHIFKIQSFEKNKIILWKKMYIKYNCELAFIYLKINKDIIKFVYIIISCLKKKPSSVFKFFLKKIFNL